MKYTVTLFLFALMIGTLCTSCTVEMLEIKAKIYAISESSNGKILKYAFEVVSYSSITNEEIRIDDKYFYQHYLPKDTGELNIQDIVNIRCTTSWLGDIANDSCVLIEDQEE